MDARIDVVTEGVSLYSGTHLIAGKNELLDALSAVIETAEGRNAGPLAGCTITVVLD